MGLKQKKGGSGGARIRRVDGIQQREKGHQGGRKRQVEAQRQT
jgi:hypothetical protein